MSRLYLVRHGRAAAGFGDALDPSLDDLGREQAEAAAAKLAHLGPLAILSSPLRRARETSLPLARRWQREPAVEPAVAEIPSPAPDFVARAQWLDELMKGAWASASSDLAQWRMGVVSALARQRVDTVVFTHFIAINVAVGAALNDDRVVVFSPANCSVTIIDLAGGRLQLIKLGCEAESRIT